MEGRKRGADLGGRGCIVNVYRGCGYPGRYARSAGRVGVGGAREEGDVAVGERGHFGHLAGKRIAVPEGGFFVRRNGQFATGEISTIARYVWATRETWKRGSRRLVEFKDSRL